MIGIEGARVLVVDGEQSMLEMCADALRKLPQTEVLLESQSRAAIERLSTGSVDLLVADIRHHINDNLDLFRTARRIDPNLPVLILTDTTTVKAAVECMKLGSADYITKPFYPEDFISTVRHLLETKRLREEYRQLQWQNVRAH